jgi:hypothetical protein
MLFVAGEKKIFWGFKSDRLLGDAASAIGINRPLNSYSQDEALRLINAVVTTYVETMVQEHERSKYPPVRMQLSPPDGRNS